MRRSSWLVTFALASLGAPFAACADDPSPASPAATPDASDALAAEAGDSPDADASCGPRGVIGFTPKWRPPSGAHQAKCTAAQGQMLADCVWTHPERDPTACDAFLNAAENRACVRCGYTSTTATTLGAVIADGTSVQTNFAGCVALTTGDLGPDGCGAKVQAAAACQDESCKGCAPASAAFDACFGEAGESVCESYTTAAACARADLFDGSPVAACTPFTEDFGLRAALYIDLFCGGLLEDAGSDADASD